MAFLLGSKLRAFTSPQTERPVSRKGLWGLCPFKTSPLAVSRKTPARPPSALSHIAGQLGRAPLLAKTFGKSAASLVVLAVQRKKIKFLSSRWSKEGGWIYLLLLKWQADSVATAASLCLQQELQPPNQPPFAPFPWQQLYPLVPTVSLMLSTSWSLWHLPSKPGLVKPY